LDHGRGELSLRWRRSSSLPPRRFKRLMPLAVKKQTVAIGLLTDDQKKADFRTRLELYQQKKPYRQSTPK
jgi:hypothetical protein